MKNENNGQDTKERLLLAARNVFAAKGYDSATVRDICQEAGVNVAAVNYHFGGKETLYAMVLERIFTEYENRLDPGLTAIADDPGRPFEERLRAYVHAGVRQLYHQDCDGDCAGGNAPFSIFLMEMAHPSAHLDNIVRRFIEPDSERLEEILRVGLGPNAPEMLVHDCANSVWGQLLHVALCWPIEARLYGEEHLGRMLEHERLAEHIYRLTLGGLRLMGKKPDTNHTDEVSHD